MEEWFEIRKGGDFSAIGEKYGIDPLIARLIRNRGVDDEQGLRTYLYGTLEDLYDPMGLDGIEKAAQLIYTKIRDGKRIRVIGDYDIDGVCATYILVHTLTLAGAIVDYRIPERIKDGYGINMRLVEEAISDKIDTIVTCDNGIAAVEQVRRGKEQGLTFIVTDHHEPFEVLPAADALVNPKKPGCTYENKNLCGAAVAWKLMYVYESCYLRRNGKRLPAEECPITMSTLPFAGFATVGDVMPLTGENRILVKYALRMLPETQNIGMQALLSVCGLKGQEISCYHIGFVLGPAINAGGRLETAMIAEQMLLINDPAQAREKALELSALNESRKNMTEDGKKTAMEQIDGGAMKNDRVLVVYLPGVHESVAGIIAGKLKERYHKPSIVLTDAYCEKDSGLSASSGNSDDQAGGQMHMTDILKGSGRSIEEYSMFEGLCGCEDLLEKFGGHPMAAGLSLRKANLEEFRRRINEQCTLTEEELALKVKIDARLPFSYLSENFVSQLKLLEPCGNENQKPVFAQAQVNLISGRILGKNRNVFKLQVSDSSGTLVDALYFGDISKMEQYLKSKGGDDAFQKLLLGQPSGLTLMIAYYPDINEFRGVRTLQIVIRNYR